MISSGHDFDEGSLPWYERMFKACEVLPGKELLLKNSLSLIARGLSQYRAVSERLVAEDVENFAWILGAIHFKEATCDFDRVLHNGENIVGKNLRTTLAPKGRGPFKTWSDAAFDAIRYKCPLWSNLLYGAKEIGSVLYAIECYNGRGYVTGTGKSVVSPYLWACSNISSGPGKYVADGHFDPTASTDKSVGAALILKDLSEAGLFKLS